jgi:hypothetical protein
MAAVTLSDGRAFDIDLRQIRRFEFDRLARNQVTDEEASAIMGRTVGLSVDDVLALSMMDWRNLFWAILVKGTEPLADPNSARPSTSA